MANGYVIGSGGGSSLEPKGNEGIPIYIDSEDELQLCTYISLPVHGIADKAKLLCKDDGTPYAIGTDKKSLIYFNDGIPVASDLTIGSSTKPVYVNNGKLTLCNDTIDNDISGKSASSDKLYINTTASSTTYYILGASGTDAGSKKVYNAYNSSGDNNKNGIRFNAKTGVLLGAAWNDYAEYRLCDENAGVCVIESSDGKLIKSTKRLLKCGNIVSDTYGFIIGTEDDLHKPIAIAGRVLAKTNESLKIGDVVCTGKNGTVSKMNRIEIILFPDRVIGIVSEIPTYTRWNNIDVNNRIWIKVR